MKTNKILLTILLLGLTINMYAQLEFLGLRNQRVNTIDYSQNKEINDLIVCGTDTGVYIKNNSNSDELRIFNSKTNVVIAKPFSIVYPDKPTNCIVLFIAAENGLFRTKIESQINSTNLVFDNLGLQENITALDVDINPDIIGTTEYSIFAIKDSKEIVTITDINKKQVILAMKNNLNKTIPPPYNNIAICYDSESKGNAAYKIFVGTNNGVYWTLVSTREILNSKGILSKQWYKVGTLSEKINVLKLNNEVDPILLAGTEDGNVYIKFGAGNIGGGDWIKYNNFGSKITALDICRNPSISDPLIYDIVVGTNKSGAYKCNGFTINRKDINWQYIGLKDKEVLSAKNIVHNAESFDKSTTTILLGTNSGIYQYISNKEYSHISISEFNVTEIIDGSNHTGKYSCHAKVDYLYRHPYVFTWSAIDENGIDIGGFKNSKALDTIWTSPINNSGIDKKYTIKATASCSEAKDTKEINITIVPKYEGFRFTLYVETINEGYKFIVKVTNLRNECISISYSEGPYIIYTVKDTNGNEIYKTVRTQGITTSEKWESNETKTYTHIWQTSHNHSTYTVYAYVLKEQSIVGEKKYYNDVEIGPYIINQIAPVSDITNKITILLQNYPNPFNPECWIPYEIKNEGIKNEVQIRIYNVLGQKVRELELGQKQAGSYITKDKSAYWDGKDNKGKEVVSGVYYYELVVDGKVIGMKKGVVLK